MTTIQDDNKRGFFRGVPREINFLNALLMAIPFAFCWYGYCASRIVSPYSAKENWLIIGLYFLLYVIYGRTYDVKFFEILQFRKMRVDAEKGGMVKFFLGANDGRITPIGEKLRVVRFDEFPQLFNIPKCDMSFVGV